MKLPEKVRVGETLSARWLNQVVDCLKELGKAANMVGNGTSTSSIEYSGSELRDTKYRGTGGSDLQEFKVFPFQLRLKPKHLCEVDESGNWPKIAQIKAGAIIDYMGKTRPVPENATIYDYTEGWVDIGAFSEKLEKVFCVIKQNYKGEIISADISSEQKDFVPWGKTEENATGEGTLSVFIGTYQLRRINEVNRAHIYQAHTGTLDLQTVQVEKLVTEDGGSGSGSGNGSGEEEEKYYTAPESEEYESKPASLFRKRDEHLFIFKKLICGEGLELADGKNLKITLCRANSVWPSGSGGSASGSSDVPTITIGGVEDIVFDREILEPLIEAGIIRIPYADTIKEVTGVISGLVVKYAPAVLNDDGSVTFLGEDGSRLPDTPAPVDAGSGSASGSGAAAYHNQIVGGVIYITIPIFQEGSGSQSMSASASGSDSASASASGSDGDTESATGSVTVTESGSASASGSGSASGSASGSGSASASASASEASGSTGASDSTAGSSSVAGSSSSSSGGGSASSGSSGGGSSSSGGGSVPGGSVPGGSVPGGGSSSGSSGESACCGCDCATKLADMQAKIDALEARIADLEAKATPECTCKCGDLLAQIQAAVTAEAQAIANSINYEVSVNGAVVATTEYGTLVADTTGSVTANGASASSNIHY